MKKIFILIMVISLITSFSSCAVQKTAHTYQQQVDTVRVVEHEIVHKEVIKTVPDSASIKALIKCNEKGEALIQQITELNTGRAIKPSIKIVRDTLTLECTIDSLAIYHEYYGRFHQEDSTSIDQVEQEEEVKKEPAMLFNRWLLSYSIILTLIVVLYLVIKFRKR
jgi:hypothetical protein